MRSMIDKARRKQAVEPWNVFRGSLYIASRRKEFANTVIGQSTDRNIPDNKNDVSTFIVLVDKKFWYSC